MANSHHYLEARRLAVGIDGHHLLSDISFRLYPGEMCALIGPSGAGKSTLIKSLLGMIACDGHIRLPDPGQPTAYVPQDDHLHLGLSVEQELDFACQLRLPQLSRPRRQAHVKKIACDVGLGERLSLPIRRLSGGQRKRVSIALELLTQPALLILDEPTSGLDPGMDTQMMQLFARIAASERILLVATHNMQNLECCQLLLLMMQGRMVWFGSPAEALTWFGVDTFEQIFIRLQQRSASEHALHYRQSEQARAVARRLPPGILRQRQQLSASTSSTKETSPPEAKAASAAEILRRLRDQHRSS